MKKTFNEKKVLAETDRLKEKRKHILNEMEVFLMRWQMLEQENELLRVRIENLENNMEQLLKVVEKLEKEKCKCSD